MSRFKVDPLDHDDQPMLEEELRTVGQARPAARKILDCLTNEAAPDGTTYLIGLAFSGGGVRSATVSLGVMQKLAADGLLKHVDYLSTVSGGGFIGSALTWWLRNKRPIPPAYDTDFNLPFGTTDPKDPEYGNHPPLEYLRAQGKYLTPGSGLSVWSGIAVVLRSIFLNLLIWVPVTTLIFLILHGIGSLPILNGLSYLLETAAPGLLREIARAAGAEAAVAGSDVFPPAFLLFLLIAAVLFALFLFISLNTSLLTWTAENEPGSGGEARKPVGLAGTAWINAGLISLAGIAVLVAVSIWLAMEVVEPLFGTKDNYSVPAGGLWKLWPWLIAIAAATIALRRWLGGRKRRKQIWLVVCGFGVLVALDFVLSRFSPEGWPRWLWSLERISALLQFLAGVLFLAYANYWMGRGISWVLRFRGAGVPPHETREPGPAMVEYRSRRLFEEFSGGLLLLAFVLAAVGILPFLSVYIQYGLGGVSAALGAAFAVAAQVRARTAGHGRLTSALIVIGAGLLVYGVLLIGYRFGLTFMEGGNSMRAAIAASIVVAFIVGWFANTNHVGLHRFYRDRLMEAYMPDEETVHAYVNREAGRANEFALKDSWAGADAKNPFHIVNTNVVLSNSTNRKYRLRGGDNFVLTATHIGSNATGWSRLKLHANRDITLASAMAISGAAANPRGGAGGKGLTRSPAVSIAMSLLNIRLGYWLLRPLSARKRGFSLLSGRPNHFWPGGVYALTGTGYRESSNWLELSDGGHFENLAVYELVRRRCGLVIVCDGAQDNRSSYSDLVSAVQRIGQDFGAKVTFNFEVLDPRTDAWKPSGPARLIATQGNTDYPKGAEFADKGYLVATIDYGARAGDGWPQRGILIYLKSTLIQDLDIRAKGYRGAHADFPQQSTSDQFFDEEQFEAYREVGYCVCAQMIEELGLRTLFARGRPNMTRLNRNTRFRPSRNA